MTPLNGKTALPVPRAASAGRPHRGWPLRARIVNLSSAANRVALPELPYAMAKCAVNALSRVGLPADVAAAIAFLASDDARWLTGNVLDVTGGWFLGPRI